MQMPFYVVGRSLPPLAAHMLLVQYIVLSEISASRRYTDLSISHSPFQSPFYSGRTSFGGAASGQRLCSAKRARTGSSPPVVRVISAALLVACVHIQCTCTCTCIAVMSVLSASSADSCAADGHGQAPPLCPAPLSLIAPPVLHHSPEDFAHSRLPLLAPGRRQEAAPPGTHTD